MNLRLPATLAVLVVGAAATLSACGSSSSPGSDGSAGGAPEQKVTIATGAPYAPWQFFLKDGKTLTGAEVDLMTAIGKAEGMDFVTQNVDFDGIIPGVLSGKYDATASGLGVTATRLKAVDFIPDAKIGYAIATTVADKGKYDTLTDLCGQKVDTGSASKELQDLYTANGNSDQGDSTDPNFGVCKDNQIKIDIYSIAGSFEAMETGKENIFIGNTLPLLDMAKKFPGKYYVAPAYATVYQGIGVAKTNTALANTIMEGLKKLIDDGEYKQILEKYSSYFEGAKGIAETAITDKDVKLLQ